MPAAEHYSYGVRRVWALLIPPEKSTPWYFARKHPESKEERGWRRRDKAG